jgi:hypothetical protein
MPIRYRPNHARRRVIITIDGLVQVGDIAPILERQRADGAATYGTLCDLRQMTGVPTLAELRQILSQAAVRTQLDQPRGAVAVVMQDTGLYRMGRMYLTLLGFGGRTVQVFCDVDEAERWLTAETRL